MRVDPNLYHSVDAAMQRSEQALQTASQQLSSGKRVSLPSDDPLAFATNVQSLAASASVDRYTKNADAVLSHAQTADSALSSVVTSLTQAVSLGTEGANDSVNSSQRASLAEQVQGLLSNVLAQANLTSNGAPLFAGTAATTTPFVLDPTATDGVSYQGNSDTNQAQVGDGLQVDTNLPGNTIFTNSTSSVFGSLQQMVNALQSGSATAIGAATKAVTTAISHVGEVRVFYGNTTQHLTAQADYLSQETVSLTSQQTTLTGIDLATAATNLTQAETANSAVLAMAAKILPVSLLNYLQ